MKNQASGKIQWSRTDFACDKVKKENLERALKPFSETVFGSTTAYVIFQERDTTYHLKAFLYVYVNRLDGSTSSMLLQEIGKYSQTVFRHQFLTWFLPSRFSETGFVKSCEKMFSAGTLHGGSAPMQTLMGYKVTPGKFELQYQSK